MGKVCWINGQPYLVSLPLGGKGKDARNNHWDEMINFLGDDCNNIFHWKEMYSWCQEVVEKLHGTIRGYYSARFWNNHSATAQSVNVGFRPVLTPLDPGTLKPDVSLLEDIPNGTRIALASLYMGGKVIAEPQKPVSYGDIADYILGAEITLGNRDEWPGNWLHVIKYGDLLWVDRNVLKNISWVDLEAQGFIGKN